MFASNNSEIHDSGEKIYIFKQIGHDNHINIFGGYTNDIWNKLDNGSDTLYKKEFIFTLSNEYNVLPMKFDYIKTKKKPVSQSTSSLSFGYPYSGSNDKINICDAIYIFKERKSHKSSYCSLSPCNDTNVPYRNSLFVNTNDMNSKNYFLVNDYEVWGRC
ncbi:hypothetical protein WA158_006418 [Blastocystis sp. Blastoise]